MKKNMIYPDKQNAENTVQRFIEQNGKMKKREKELLYLISSYSRFLGRAAVADPELLTNVLKSGFITKTKSPESFNSETHMILNESLSEDELSRNLRIYKYRELARIVYKDILKTTEFINILYEISDLAESIISAVYRFYAAELKIESSGSFFILAMGKLGGRLLNLSSDVDLIYLYKEKKQPDLFFKLAEKITNFLSAVAEGGFLYRVDLGLRPGGGKSNIAVSFEGAVEHYYYWGDTWERAALIQARPIAGDIGLGGKFIKELDRFVYKKSLDFESIEDLKDMKMKLDRLKKLNNVKLGKGGIREIEFFVQANQLVNAGQYLELKGLNTLDCLLPLAENNILTQENKATLENSYLFLRRVEHNIQLADEIQTHKIPSDPEQYLLLSKRTGYKNVKSFSRDYDKNTRDVSRIYGKLFYEPTRKIEEYGEEFWHAADFLTEGNVTEDEALESLKSLGFKNPSAAVDLISTLIDSKRGAMTQKGRLISRRVIPAFLAAVIKSYDPDTAILNLEKFITTVGWKTSIYAVLFENPDMLNLLARFFSTSGVLSTFLIKHPEYLDILTLKSARKEYGSEEEMLTDLRNLVDSANDYEAKLDALRHFKHVETLKLCLRDLNREINAIYVGKYLSMIAQAILKVSLDLAIKETGKHHKSKERLNNILILGMGKFSAGEMSYNSDLDLIFIYGGKDHEAFSKLGQRLISILSVPTSEGICYKIDLDLRPSGRSGTLVTSYDSFKKYHEESAQLWERQALIRAMPCGGDEKLAVKVMKTVTDFVYMKPLDKEFHREISRIRVRMEKELAKETLGKVNVKTGKGGLVDIEFLVQMLQLRYGKRYRSVRHANTLESIKALSKNKLIPPEDAETLTEGYIFLKTLENLLRLLKDKSVSDIKDSDFDRLAVESIIFKTGKDIKTMYKVITQKIRKVYERYFN